MRFKYTPVDNTPTGFAPRLTLLIHNEQHVIEVNGLVDSGAAVNLLPYPLGLALDALWEEQPVLAPLVGSLGRLEARGLSVFISHPQLIPNEPVHQVFAWTEAQDALVLFGQENFFMEFEVCFYRAQGYFKVNHNRPR